MDEVNPLARIYEENQIKEVSNGDMFMSEYLQTDQETVEVVASEVNSIINANFQHENADF